MTVEMVLSVIATDRPGLVRTLAEAVAAHDGNWIDSSMARLGGEFAGIVRVALPDGAVAPLEGALAGLAQQGITVVARRSQGAPPPTRAATLELTCADTPGIVREIAAALAEKGVSIDELETSLFEGSMSGQPLFSARARLALPEGLDADVLRETFEAIGQDIMAEIVLRDIE
ncbi:glycine cleavage system protein R [Salinarimonas soli]|uniref:ACT domain-containing protein n=1 Tax=Salinarimonas soli TaxID=1638099 RepID=A0A5B2VB11_9HYPH|nr:ACT domain-containing protein [Salinarimonas soli]KAA2236211.1 ACT domain-containing protein [Salinarimonas soli]